MQTCVVRSRQPIALKPLIVILVITLNCHSWITGLYILFNLKHCVVWLTKYVRAHVGGRFRRKSHLVAAHFALYQSQRRSLSRFANFNCFNSKTSVYFYYKISVFQTAIVKGCNRNSYEYKNGIPIKTVLQIRTQGKERRYCLISFIWGLIMMAAIQRDC